MLFMLFFRLFEKLLYCRFAFSLYVRGFFFPYVIPFSWKTSMIFSAFNRASFRREASVGNRMFCGAQVASRISVPLFPPDPPDSPWSSSSSSCFDGRPIMMSLTSCRVFVRILFLNLVTILGSNGDFCVKALRPIKYCRYGFIVIWATVSSSENW